MSKQIYNQKLIRFAKENRKKPTYAENKLWKLLKNKAFGVKFRRQVPISNYILDFYYPSKQLCIEIDGSSHDENRFESDLKRESELKELGIKFLRFTENQVMNSEKEVVETIELKLEELA